MTEDTATEMRPSEADSTIERVIQLYFTATDKLASFIWAICVITGAILVLVITAQVITRYILGFVPAWGSELSRYMMIWITLLLAGVLIKDDKHLQVEFVFQRLPLTVRRIIRSIELLIVFWVGLFFFFQGWYYAATSGFRSTAPAMGFDMFWTYIVFPISGVIIMIFSTRKLIEINYYPDTLDRDYNARFQAYEEDQKTKSEEVERARIDGGDD
ncbi:MULTISPECIES: TRAP transporter small permease [Natrialbaceae]|uniref:TRAP transporter small permease n=1 Tax=Natrialbaceae TaxID=1644061 RepID=UPI00207C492D|nr:TRAP transporter small permease [Natronococcus sp. CG52]